MQLVWSALSLADRDAIFDYIEVDNPLAAIAIDERIEEAIDHLRRFPESGRVGRVEGTRELVITGTAYIAAYVVLPGKVRILRVLHGAMPWPDAMPE